MLKYVLLGFLNYQPMSGYDLSTWMEASTDNFWHAKLSQIYTTLKKLEKEGLVVSHIEPQEGRPDRRVYTVTKAGQADFNGWLQTTLTEMPVKKDELLVKVFFGFPAGKEIILTQLRLQLDLHRRKLAQYQAETPEMVQHIVDKMPDIAPHTRYWELTRQFGEAYEKLYVDWLENTIAIIENDFE